MNVSNPSDSQGVYVDDHGVIQAGGSAKVRDSKQVRELLKAGVLVKSDEQKKEADE